MKWSHDYVKNAAQSTGFVAGFNVFGYEDAQAVILAAERADAPVLLMVNRDARAALALPHWAALLASMAQAACVPVGVHLDHCDDPAAVREAIDLGFTSVMYDGSHQPFMKNVQNTAAICQYAHDRGVLVEAELGTVPYAELGETESRPTSPEEAAALCAQTGADWLAVSVGNVHRLLGRKARIDFDALRRIEAACATPLVIHGASGLDEQDVRVLRDTRVGKINVGTALRRAFGEALRAEVEQRPAVYDRQALFAAPIASVEAVAFEIISQQCGTPQIGGKRA